MNRTRAHKLARKLARGLIFGRDEIEGVLTSMLPDDATDKESAAFIAWAAGVAARKNLSLYDAARLCEQWATVWARRAQDALNTLPSAEEAVANMARLQLNISEGKP